MTTTTPEAVAALVAELEDAAPVDAVAWMYSHAGYPVLSVLRRDMPGWTETPLYAHPDPRVAELERENAALRAKGDALGGS